MKRLAEHRRRRLPSMAGGLAGALLVLLGMPIQAGATTRPLQEDPVPAAVLAQEASSVLRRHCVGCHQPARAKGGVDLSSFAVLLAGTRSGETLVVPGQPEASLLLSTVCSVEGEPPEMPKDADPLSVADVDCLRRWIAAGAVDAGEAARPSVDAEHPPQYHSPPVISSLDWSPDGAHLAVSGFHEALLYDAEARLEARLIGLSERVEALSFSPDGSQLAVVGGSPARFGEVQVWSLGPPKLRLSRLVTADVLFGLSWSPQGDRIAFGGTDSAVRVIDAQDGEEVLYQGAHEDWVLGTCFSKDGQHLVSVSRDRSMKLILVPEQQFIDNITSITPGALRGGLQAVDRHPGEDQLLVGGADGVPRLYKMFREKKRVIGDDYNLLRALTEMEGRVFDVAFSGDGALAAAASSRGDGGRVQLSGVEDGALRWAVDWDCGAYAVAFHPGGERLVAAGFDGVLREYALADGALLRETVVMPEPARSEAAAATEASADTIKTETTVQTKVAAEAKTVAAQGEDQQP